MYMNLGDQKTKSLQKHYYYYLQSSSMSTEAESNIFSSKIGDGLCCRQSVSFCGPCVVNRTGPEGQHLRSLFLKPQYKEGSGGH